MAKGFHIMAKPVGALCNMDCTYCFYTEKTALFPKEENYIMQEDILKKYIQDTIAQDIPEITFVWQGGEPMLAGIGFYEKAIQLQEQYAGQKRISNLIQTNGTLIDQKWCKFFKENNFFVGVSLDGPKKVNDKYRSYKNGDSTFQAVIKSIHMLEEYEIEFNVLACVGKETAKKPLETYDFFKKNGIQFIQFTPVVERQPDEVAASLGLKYAYGVNGAEMTPVTSWSVEPEAYGKFLSEIFDEWVKKDVGRITVMNFEWALTAWLGLESTVCIYGKQCGGCSILEHDGMLYSCDHYMYPEYCLGNIREISIQELMNSDRQKDFGKQKEAGLPKECQQCDVLFACRGECPRHRFQDNGTSYLCAGYQYFFKHIHPYMKVMVQLIQNRRPASEVMEVIKHPLVIYKAKAESGR